jgi:hypothetical protein
MRRHGIFGGGGRYNESLAHGDDELATVIHGVEAILKEAA